MCPSLRHLCHGLLAPFCVLIAMGGTTLAADLSPAPAAAVETPLAALPTWTFRFTPYGWLISLNGTQTVRGRSESVNASFLDVLEQSDSLVALMGDAELRNGPFALFGDVVWTKIGLDRSTVRSRALAPGVSGTVGAALSLDVEMAIVEAGAAYEVARLGPLAFDVLAGMRYWHQSADLSLGIAAGVQTADLAIAGARAIARSGSVDWLDPLVGARIRYAVAPGQELFLRGDIGGFGAGSDFSWQAFGGYGFDFGTYNGITFSGVIGYRALSVDYAQGEGRRRYEFDMLQHGPVLGISARF
ncbi:hypothetical protein GGR34_003813 [Microvirga flocculans]|uniref:Outer membrane protein beta-barrel domain-containing protein n=1 Tax=Microvirga flocculans TaxID=217168 RepID=A0A7W6IIK9_9HYPH|nr:hypothetical protein [Microvirga flocculans]MBB4042128.1 hypothetical protein [Microvirga flocculans]